MITQSGNLLEMRSISKSFPGVQALDEVDLSVRNGEIHGLVGENGAGKSTIIKVLAGVYARNSGSVNINGQSFEQLTPQAVHDAGVRFIHQELHLVPHFTVAESVFLGQELSGVSGLKNRQMQRVSSQFLKESLNADISGHTLIRELGVAERKLVQIARALIDDKATLLVFDEPTAPLASSETEQVFNAIRRLNERGITMVYVSHYLGEITDACDRVTVLRNGKSVAVLDDITEALTDSIIRHMVGRDIQAMYPENQHQVGDTLLEVKSLSDGSRFANIDLTVGKGEIVGVAGLIGSGREELIDTLYGLQSRHEGTVSLEGMSLDLNSPSDAVVAGIVLVPRDRRNDGLVLEMSVADNINLASLDSLSTARLERKSLALKLATKMAEKLDIRPRNVKAIVRFLSGGNQQKVILARWLATQSRLFILDEPTVGVDVGAKVEIYELIERLSRQGAGVIVSSSDPAELLGLCDRIAIMHRGKLIATRAATELSLDQLISLTTAGNIIGTVA